jgi:hypothetical protein
LQNKESVFIEHYPLHKKELKLVMHWPRKKIRVLNALDEPWLAHFGGEKIIAMAKQLGMGDNEMLQHPMISKAIANAQEKIAKKDNS